MSKFLKQCEDILAMGSCDPSCEPPSPCAKLRAFWHSGVVEAQQRKVEQEVEGGERELRKVRSVVEAQPVRMGLRTKLKELQPTCTYNNIEPH